MNEKVIAKIQNLFFDEKTCQALKCYVYMLIDSRTDKPFYVGKGTKNRVFDHILQALENKKGIKSDKLGKIRSIYSSGHEVKHIIVHHGLNEASALLIESSLIDTLRMIGEDVDLTNIQSGHDIEHGLLSDVDIRGKYSAEIIRELPDNFVVININRVYERGMSSDTIYNKVRGDWVIAQWRLGRIKYVLAEYKGLILDVFSVTGWEEVVCSYQSKHDGTRTRTRYKFTKGDVDENLRNQYIGKRIPPFKK